MTSPPARRSPLLLLLLALLLAACGDDRANNNTSADAGTDAPDLTDPDSDDNSDAPPDMTEDAYTPPVLEDGVVLTAVSVPGFAAPPNPVSGAATPPEASMARFVRYTLGEPGPLEEREGVLVMVPGFLAGAGSFDALARQVVQRTQGRFEVWAVDRRSNGLEDHRGMEAAVAALDPELAQGYYFDGALIDGERFAGLQAPAALDFASEWGLEVHLGDLRAILALVPPALRERHLFLGGHSLGASLVQAYASFTFEDGHQGHDDIAGLILYDGAVGAGGEPPTEAEFLEGYQGFMGRAPGLTRLREGRDVVAALPFVPREVFLTVEIVAMRASAWLSDPAGVTPDENVDSFFSLAMQATPRATHEATLGMAFDQEYQPFFILNANLGRAASGRLTPYASLLVPGATLIRPDDPDALYTWQRWDELEEPEATDLQSFALSIYAGPSNFAEWYFPTRLQLDLAAAGDLAPIPEGDWRRQHGLRLDAVGAADMPVFAIGAERGLVTDTAAWDAWVAKLPATTRAGATRAQPEGYTALIAPGQAHLDVVNAHNQGDLDHSLAPLLRWAQGITQGQTFPLDAP